MKFVIYAIPLAYVLVCVAAYLFQSRLVFFPDRHDGGTPADAGLDFTDIFFSNCTGRQLHAWLVVPAKDTAVAAPAAGHTLLYCHGNAGNISSRVTSISQFTRLGFAVFIFDYAGFGRSQGRPSEDGVYDDAHSAFEYLTDKLGVAPEKIVVYGRSLGSAVAIELATRVTPRALILEACFTSIPEMGARTYPWLPIKFISRIRFDNLDKVAHVRSPMLFVHSIEDETVPYGMGRRVAKRAPDGTRFLKIRGAHDAAMLLPRSEYEAAVGELLG